MAEIPPPPPGFVPMSSLGNGIPPPPPGFVPESSLAKSRVPSIFEKAISNDVPGLGGWDDPLGHIAKLGGDFNRKVQKDMGDEAENFGRMNPNATPAAVHANALLAMIPATASEFLVPQNRLAAGLTVLGPAVRAAKALPGAVDAIANDIGKAPKTIEESGKAIEAAKHAASAESAGLVTPAAEEAASAAKAAEKAAAKPNKPGLIAQFIQSRAGRGITPGMAQYAVDNPGVFDRAASVEEATAKYADSIGGLKGKTQSIAERLNKTRITPADYDAAIDRAGRLLNGTPTAADIGMKGSGAAVQAALAKAKLTPQDALEGVQSINQALRDKMYTSQLGKDQVGEILGVKDKLMDFLQNNGAPGVRKAAKDLFESHVKDAFSDWLPKNKYGTTDAMRTMMGMKDLAGAAALTIGGLGHTAIPIAANALASSPRIIRGVLENAAAVPKVAETAATGAKAISNMVGKTPETPSMPPAQSPALIQKILSANTLNPAKSGQWGREISGIGLPSSMVSKSGNTSISKLAQLLHDAGAINENDEGEAVAYLKSISGKVK